MERVTARVVRRASSTPRRRMARSGAGATTRTASLRMARPRPGSCRYARPSGRDLRLR
jgi:hypothetical protein